MRPWFGFPLDVALAPATDPLTAKAKWALVQLFAVSSEYMTDGMLPLETARKHAGETEIEALTSAGLLELAGEKLRLVDFLEVNASRERREARREQSRGRSAAFRERKRESVTRDERAFPSDLSPIPSGLSSADLRERKKEGRVTRDATRDEQEGTGRPPAQAPATPPCAEKASTAEQPNSREGRRRPAHPARDQVMAAFGSAYRDATGSDPTWTRKALGLADQLARSHSIEEIRARLERCYVDRKPAWVWRRGGVPDLAMVAMVWDQLVPVAPPKDYLLYEVAPPKDYLPNVTAEMREDRDR